MTPSVVTITYTYLDENRLECVGVWQGDYRDALRAAEEELDAKLDPEDGWSYYATETAEECFVTVDDLVAYGAAILAQRAKGTWMGDIYSCWCNKRTSRKSREP